MQIPASGMVGEEGKAFVISIRHECRADLIAAECIGDAKWFMSRPHAIQPSAPSLTGQSVKTGHPVSIARAYSQMRAAELMLHEANRLYEEGENPGEEASLAKLLCADIMGGG